MDRKIVALDGRGNKEKYYMKYKVGDYVCGIMRGASGEEKYAEGWVLSPTNHGLIVMLRHTYGTGNAELVASLGPIIKMVNPTDYPNRTKQRAMNEVDLELSEEIAAFSGSITSKLNSYTRKLEYGETTPEVIYGVYLEIVKELSDFLNEVIDGNEQSLVFSELERILVGSVISTDKGERYIILSAVCQHFCESFISLLVLPYGGGHADGVFELCDAVSIEVKVENLKRFLEDDRYRVTWLSPNRTEGIQVHYFDKEIGYQVALTYIE